ncbi:MAG: FHA domain-containing protein [Bacteriovorax sp.]
MKKDSTVLYKNEFYFVGAKYNFEINSTTTIGRNSADINFQDDKLSSTHCKLTVKGTNLFITDLDSSNGTIVNGKKLSPRTETELNFGDRVQIGSDVYVIYDAPQKTTVPTQKITAKAVEPIQVSTNKTVTEPVRPDNSIDYFNLSTNRKIAYTVSIVFYLFFVYVHLYISKNTITDDLSFLLPLHQKSAIVLTIVALSQLIVIILLHVYVSAKYFKKSSFFKKASFIGLLIFQFVFLALLGGLSQSLTIDLYLEGRNKISNNPINPHNLRVFSDFKDAYTEISKDISGDQKAALTEDYEKHKEMWNQKRSIALKKNCEEEKIEDCEILGYLEFEKGNLVEAGALFKKACDAGEEKSCEDLLKLEKKKSKILSDTEISYKKACDEGKNEACIAQGEIEIKQGNTAAAEALYKKACDAGAMTACALAAALAAPKQPEVVE